MEIWTRHVEIHFLGDNHFVVVSETKVAIECMNNVH